MSTDKIKATRSKRGSNIAVTTTLVAALLAAAVLGYHFPTGEATAAVAFLIGAVAGRVAFTFS